MLPFTMEELNAAVEKGRVTKRPHPHLAMSIYNYSNECQYARDWDDITLNCRGLILTDAGGIVARPWRKFFNLGEVNLPMQFDDPVEITDKVDGSLGILYNSALHADGVDYSIATRGSFTSEQAIHATKVWQERYSHLYPLHGYTLLFEIVYPENRIVLDYYGIDNLVLLGAVHNTTGYYYSPLGARYIFHNGKTMDEWPGPVVDVMSFDTVSDALGHMARENAEGYVIRSHNFLVKMKQPDYLDLHRLVTNITSKNIWSQLVAGEPLSQIVSIYPDEFHEYVRSLAEPLIKRYEERYQEIFSGYSAAVQSVSKDASRKDFALAIKNNPDKRYYFAILDSNPIRATLWSELRPREVDLTP